MAPTHIQAKRSSTRARWWLANRLSWVTYSSVLTIESGAILDVTALGVNGYYPPEAPSTWVPAHPRNLTPTFGAAMNANYPAFV